MGRIPVVWNLISEGLVHTGLLLEPSLWALCFQWDKWGNWGTQIFNNLCNVPQWLMGRHTLLFLLFQQEAHGDPASTMHMFTGTSTKHGNKCPRSPPKPQTSHTQTANEFCPSSPLLEISRGKRRLTQPNITLKNVIYSGQRKITALHKRPALMSAEGHWNKQPLVFSWLGN